jgi:hypothetical protein
VESIFVILLAPLRYLIDDTSTVWSDAVKTYRCTDRRQWKNWTTALVSFYLVFSGIGGVRYAVVPAGQRQGKAESC